MTDVIQVTNLYKSYPQTPFQLHIPSLSVAEGETLGLIGPSGSGKTTFLNMLSGITPPTRGEIVVHGQAIEKLSDAQARAFRIVRVGFVFQDFKLIDYLSVYDNIILPYRLNPAVSLTKAACDHIGLLAEKVGIGRLLSRYPHQLSQGERQRVAICRALATRPKLLFADEATGNLDPTNKTTIMELLFDYVADSGATMLAVTHDHSLLKNFDRTVDFGNLTPTGGADER